MIVNVKLGIFSLLPLIKTISINISLELLCYVMKLACLREFVPKHSHRFLDLKGFLKLSSLILLFY